MIDYVQLKQKIRHFLLQQSEIYRRSLTGHSSEVAAVSIAKELDNRCGIGVRRLQKYLSERSSEKELSFNLHDLSCFARLSGQSLGGFVSYLLGEGVSSESVLEAKYAMVFNKMPLDLRRELSVGLFSGANHEKSARILAISRTMYLLSSQELDVMEKVVEAFASGKDRRN